MNIDHRPLKRLFAAAALGLLLPAFGAAPKSLFAQTDRQTAIEGWPAGSRRLLGAMIEKYGIPQRLNVVEAVWYDNGPWRKTVVHRDSASRFWGIKDKDYLEQFIRYQVPADKAGSLKLFGKRLEIEGAVGELSSRSASEGMNYMALNLAHEIVTGARSVEDARDFYLKTEELSRAGKSSPYLEGFLFTVEANGNAFRPE